MTRVPQSKYDKMPQLILMGSVITSIKWRSESFVAAKHSPSLDATLVYMTVEVNNGQVVWWIVTPIVANMLK